MLEHGGRLEAAVRQFGRPRDQWLDLSTGISPHAWPVPAVPAETWHRLPEDDDGLLDAARAYYGCDHLLPVAGSQAAIAALPYLRARSSVGVVSPGYAEHAHAWRQAGHDVHALPFETLVARAHEFDVVVLIHPNNPTGQRLTDMDLVERAGHEPVHGRWLVLDEAFIDTRPEQSLVSQARGGLVVLRSVGKFFGLAGARAGFVAGHPALLHLLRERLGPWTLTGPARWAVARALGDTEWQAGAREQLRRASATLAGMLRSAGMSPSGGTDLFQYCAIADAARLHHALAAHGILVRLFDDPPALRFGLPASPEAFERLRHALHEVMA